MNFSKSNGKIRILLDMDEVLVDFVGGALRAHGWSRYDFYKRHTPGSWAIERTMGLTAKQLWEPINAAGEQFWLDLEPLLWASDVVELVESFTADWHVISSPSRCPTSYTGKVVWLKRYFGTDFDRFALTPHKQIFANPSAVLIDDRDSNRDEFIAAGGRAITFPSLHNRLYREPDPVNYVTRELEGICNGR